MKKLMTLAILAVALCASALAQDGNGVQVICNKGHKNCTIVHDDDNGQTGGPINPDRGNAGDTDVVRDPDTDPQAGNPKVEPPVGNPKDSETEDARRQAEEQRQRLEKARHDEHDPGLSDEARKRAAQEALRAQARFRYEMNARLDEVKRAATSTSSKLKKELDLLQTWQEEMVKAGLTKELTQWYVQNKGSIEELVKAKPEIKWLAENKASIEDLVYAKGDIVVAAKDHAMIAHRYKDKKDSDGTSYDNLPMTYMAIENDNQNDQISKLWNSLGAEWWVKLCAVGAFLISIGLAVLKILKK